MYSISSQDVEVLYSPQRYIYYDSLSPSVIYFSCALLVLYIYFVEKILWIQHQISNTSTATLMVCFFLINPTFNYVLFSLLLEVKSLIISGSWAYNSLTISILISVSLFYYVNFIHYFKLNCVSVMALRYDDQLLYMVCVNCGCYTVGVERGQW